MSDDRPLEATDPEVAETDKKIVFHYNRERRLANAPESVRTAYEKGYTPNKGFLRGLTANAGLKSVFITILILSAAIVALSFFRDSAGTASMGGYDFKLKSFLYEESVYVTLRCAPTAPTAPSAVGAQSVQVTAVITALDRAGNVVETREITDLLQGPELQLRAKLTDFEIFSVNARVKCENTEVTLSSSVDRK